MGIEARISLSLQIGAQYRLSPELQYGCGGHEGDTLVLSYPPYTLIKPLLTVSHDVWPSVTSNKPFAYGEQWLKSK